MVNLYKVLTQLGSKNCPTCTRMMQPVVNIVCNFQPYLEATNGSATLLVDLTAEACLAQASSNSFGFAPTSKICNNFMGILSLGYSVASVFSSTS